MNTEIQDPDLIYASAKPNIELLAEQYEKAISDNDYFFAGCARSYDDRHNLWAGKSWDMRKQAANAFPWQGASDNEVNIVGERIDTFVDLCTQSMERSNIKAMPRNTAAMARAGTVSSFLKYMRDGYIPDFDKHAEQSANHFFEKGVMITYVGWKRESRSRLQLTSLDQIMEMGEFGPELVETILGGQNDDQLVQMLMDGIGITKGRAKKALRQLRAKGEAEIPVAVIDVDCPIVETCAPDGDVILPNSTTDPQRAPYLFWRTFMTAQELEKRAATDGWDKEWVEYAIEKLRGLGVDKIDGEKGNGGYWSNITDDKTLIEVIHCYQRLIDLEDGSEGIYCTVFSPRYSDSFAKHELMNGYDDYPFVITRLTEAEKRLYEVEPMTRSLRGPQMQVKTEVDSRIDAASMATLPPLMHPAGRPPSDWGPGRKVPERRQGEYHYGDVPGYNPGSKDVEIVMRQQADSAVGLNMESPLAMIRQQAKLSKFLKHWSKVLSLSLTLYERLGPPEVFFVVSGDPNGQTMTKGGEADKYTIRVTFDAATNDPETADKKVQNMISLVPLDRNGIIDVGKLIEFTAMSIDPQLADYCLMPQDQAQEKMMRDVTADLSAIAAGIAVPARPNGAQVALQFIQQYAQQEDVSQRLQGDEAFANRLTEYAKQYQFEIQQQENAQTGKIGTAPASVGNIETQGMQQ